MNNSSHKKEIIIAILQKKLKERNIKKIDNLVNILIKNDLQKKNVKLRKHFCLSSNVFDNSSFQNNELKIKCQKSDKIIPLLEYSIDNSQITSYSLSNMSPEQHLELIIDNLNINKNLTEINNLLIFKELTKENKDENFIKINDDFTKYSFKKIYLIDILPPVLSILYNKNLKRTYICNSYVVAISDKINIFFTYNPNNNVNDKINHFNKNFILSNDNFHTVIKNYMTSQLFVEWWIDERKITIKSLCDKYSPYDIPPICGFEIKTDMLGVIVKKDIYLNKCTEIIDILKKHNLLEI